jgi:hypothetical protein
MAEFDAWRRQEELAYSIEFITSRVAHGPGNKLWTLRRNYVCSRQLSGGKKDQQRKCPDRKTRDSKKTGCRCKIVIKRYPHTPIVLGRYDEEHDHDVGLANIAYTRISSASREQIKNLLEKKIDPREIVRDLS